MKQLKNTWTTFTASQVWKTSGSRLTKKVNKPSRRCCSLQERDCHLGLEDNDFDNDINPLETTGAYLSPKEFKEALLDEDTVVLDTRNDYEYDPRTLPWGYPPRYPQLP